jgi:hypothetical protein
MQNFGQGSQRVGRPQQAPRQAAQPQQGPPQDSAENFGEGIEEGPEEDADGEYEEDFADDAEKDLDHDPKQTLSQVPRQAPRPNPRQPPRQDLRQASGRPDIRPIIEQLRRPGINSNSSQAIKTAFQSLPRWRLPPGMRQRLMRKGARYLPVITEYYLQKKFNRPLGMETDLKFVFAEFYRKRPELSADQERRGVKREQKMLFHREMYRLGIQGIPPLPEMHPALRRSYGNKSHGGDSYGDDYGDEFSGRHFSGGHFGGHLNQFY